MFQRASLQSFFQTSWAFLCLFFFLLTAAARAEDPWADAVMQYSPGPGASAPYVDPSKTLGPPTGLGPTLPNNSGVVSLGGVGGSLTLRFATPVTDDPANPMGLDCIVFSNCFWNGGSPQRKFQEPALIEISEDVNGNGLADDPWYLIPGSRAFPYSPFPAVVEPAGLDNLSPHPITLLGGNITNPNALDADPSNDALEYAWGYAEMTPTQMPYLDNYVRPDDPWKVGLSPRSGGGDAFDIAWAVDVDGNPASLTRFHFIRLTSFVDRSMPGLGVVSPEIDAVADVAPEIDSDGDGILDEYETRVAGTDPFRRENTVLPLEIPASEGGGGNGALLGTARDDRGAQIRFFAGAARSNPARAFHATVDILAPPAPEGTLPDATLLPSAVVRTFQSSTPDFVAEGIQPAEITLQYQAAEIAGLEESALQPYRLHNHAYVQDGLSSIECNAAVNRVTFRTRYPGTFLLAAPAGAGDEHTSEGAHGPIALTAEPFNQCIANPANTVRVTSGTIVDAQDHAAADGTLITVSTSHGSIVSADRDAVTPGIQVAVLDGVISFIVQPAREAGAAIVRAASVQGDAYGELLYLFVPGPPAPAIYWTIAGPPQGEAPVEVEVQSTPLHDAMGNPIPDGTLLTVSVTEAAITSGDADLSQPGHQIMVSGGQAFLTISAPNLRDFFQIHVFEDAAQTRYIHSTTLAAGYYDSLPLAAVPALIAPAMAWLGCRALARTRRNSRKRA